MPLAVRALHHVGIAVRSIEAQRVFYESVLGADFQGMEEVPDQGVRVAFFRVGTTLVELLEPTSDASPIQSFLVKRGEGLHHLAYTVDSLEVQIAELERQGIRMIDRVPRPGAHGMRIAFLHPHSTGGVLTELCEPDHQGRSDAEPTNPH